MTWLKVHIFHDQNDDFFSFLFLFHWRERVYQYLLFLENVVNGSGRCFRSCREFYCRIIFSNYCLLEIKIFGVFFFFALGNFIKKIFFYLDVFAHFVRLAHKWLIKNTMLYAVCVSQVKHCVFNFCEGEMQQISSVCQKIMICHWYTIICTGEANNKFIGINKKELIMRVAVFFYPLNASVALQETIQLI